MRPTAFLVVFLCLTACAKDKPPVPDLTAGGQRDKTHDWTLGPTGARGWVWGWKGQTTDARQILITEVAAGSPCDGVLAKDDVIVGLDGGEFKDDARLLLSRAITEAEAVSGVLKLLRWRKGETLAVEVRIPVLGAYSATAPYDCPKSKRIFEQGCAAIARAGFKNKRGNIDINIPNDLRALALLASSREDYRPMVREYATAVAASTPGGHKSWGYAYETLFLAEYVLATRDRTVMPGLTRLATDIAQGQSGVGTWGHSFARPEDKILNGYGCMNQPGIVLTLAMIAAREAGVKSGNLDEAIARSVRFLRWYVGKGAIPYGDHAPWADHDDNGKCSSAAVMFDLLGDRPAAAFFSRMGAAAHAVRESGHTGNFFNLLWALPGVSRSGPGMCGAYMKETGWYYDLARNWEGRFFYQGLPAEEDSYRNWDTTGAYLLTYALPLRSLLITGKKPTVVPALTAAEIANTIESGRWNWWAGLETFYAPRSTADLLRGLSSWSPTVRERSTRALAKKEDVSIPVVVALLDSTDANTRYGALVALKFMGRRADPAAAKVRPMLLSADPWQRVLAAEAIVEMSEDIRNACVRDLLKVLLRKDDPADPRRCVMGPLCEVLFKPGPGKHEPASILRKNLDPVDAATRPLLVSALRDVLHSEDGRIRGNVGSVYPMLTPAELAQLMPDIVAAIRFPAPSGEMFAYDIRMSGLELLAKLRIREGMDYCVDIMNERRWGRDFARAERALRQYGGAARAMLPRLTTQTREAVNKETEKAALEKLITDLAGPMKEPPLRTMQEFLTNPTR